MDTILPDYAMSMHEDDLAGPISSTAMEPVDVSTLRHPFAVPTMSIPHDIMFTCILFLVQQDRDKLTVERSYFEDDMIGGSKGI